MLRGISKTKMVLASVLALSAVAVGAFGFHKVNASVIQDCSANSIIVCGEQDPSAFISKVRTNTDHGHGDLQAIYSDFGLVSSQYSQFVSYARDGVAKQDGTIVVDGQVVATNTWSIGRDHFSYASPINLSGKTYYKSANNRVLLQDLPVMVLFNSKGVMQFAVMKACGNPTTGTPVTPTYTCNALQATADSSKRNTYNFSTSASAGNNAKIQKVVYTFGDGTTDTETSPTKVVSHTYAQSGTYNAKVTVYVSLPGNQTVTVESVNCTKTITIAPPFQNCVALTAFAVSEEQRQYRFTVTTNQGNGSTLQSATFNFGDNSTTSTVNATSANTVVTDHTYAAAGNYNISATVNFNTTDGVKSVSCGTSINISQEMCAINPSVPKNSPECAPCKYNNQLPANSKACQPPVTQLPNTGAGNVIGLFAGATIAGGLAYRFVLARRFARNA